MRVRLASDPVGKVSRLYGVYKAEENLAFSGFFLVDPEGTIVAMEKSDFPVSKECFGDYKTIACLLLGGAQHGGAGEDCSEGGGQGGRAHHQHDLGLDHPDQRHQEYPSPPLIKGEQERRQAGDVSDNPRGRSKAEEQQGELGLLLQQEQH